MSYFKNSVFAGVAALGFGSGAALAQDVEVPMAPQISPLAVGVCSDELAAVEGTDDYCGKVEQAIQDINDWRLVCVTEHTVRSIQLEQAIASGEILESDREQTRYSDLFDYQACFSGMVDGVNAQLYDIFSRTVLGNINLDKSFSVVVSDEFGRLSDAMPKVYVTERDGPAGLQP